MVIHILIPILCQLLITESSSSEISPYSPLIILPGFAGSREYFQNFQQSSPVLVWIDPYYLDRTSILTEYIKLQYNKTSHTTYNLFGYEYIWKGWGQTYTIEKLSDVPLVAYTDYHGMIKNILKTKYYKRNVTLRGAPYDFRKAPNELKPFYDKLKLLVEETYQKTSDNRVVLIGHSLGCLNSLAFIKQMKLEWKKMYLKSFICVSGPLGGAVQSLLMETTGKSVLFFKGPLLYREFERTFPSTAFLLPKYKYFTNQTLVQTPTRKYTTQSYQELFSDMNFNDGFSMYKDVKGLVNESESPTGVDEIHCFHGDGQKTIESYSIKHFNDTKPLFKYGPGDGTVNQISLEICKLWKDVKYNIIKGATHKNILHNNIFIKKLMEILANK